MARHSPTEIQTKRPPTRDELPAIGVCRCDRPRHRRRQKLSRRQFQKRSIPDLSHRPAGDELLALSPFPASLQATARTRLGVRFLPAMRMYLESPAAHRARRTFTTNDTPTCVASAKPVRDTNKPAHAVVDMTAQLQWSYSPPAVERNAKLHRLVQPTLECKRTNPLRCAHRSGSVVLSFRVRRAKDTG